jgi:ribosome recycling factor
MGHIAEPKGVDFTIQSPPLTEAERKELSAFIKKRKEESKKESPLEATGKNQ